MPKPLEINKNTGYHTCVKLRAMGVEFPKTRLPNTRRIVLPPGWTARVTSAQNSRKIEVQNLGGKVMFKILGDRVSFS